MPDAAAQDPRQLIDVLADHGVTRIVLVPSLLHTLLETCPNLAGRLPRLTHWVSSGERLRIEELRRFQDQLPDARLINLYGSSEVSADVTCFDVGASDVGNSIPIGRPISNTQVYVLDKRRHPVPIGVAGELYVGGAGLARGYLKRPELTADRFIQNPFSAEPDARLYRTGDLCRWRADGNLEFLGRIDDQVKLRGFRIELGEIETLLNEHTDVAQCVVTLREDRAGDKRLVAYCVPAGESELNFSTLRRHLQQRLPDYMLPAAFVALDMLPLTPSGKVDRRVLPVPDDSRPHLETGYVAPRNTIEQQLASIWCEVLGIDKVGVHDNFFALGGHSLLATRVNARVASTLQVDLPLRKLFETPTIAAFSSEIETLRGGRLSSRGKALERVDRERVDPLPLSFAQQRLWFLEQLEGELTAYNLPFSWKLRGPLDTAALRRAMDAIVRRHESLRTTFTMIEDEPVQVIVASERFELPVEDLSSFEPKQQETEIVRRCQLEAERPFDLTRDLMLRASLLRLAEDEHLLLLTMHHIASDGWSLRILWRELERLYDAHCCGAKASLPELPVQYADYAVWQRSELKGRRLEELLQYWRTQLDGVRVLDLPTDRPRPTVPTYHGARHTFELTNKLVDQLKSLSQSAGVTLHMTLLAAFQTLLSRYSGQDDIAVGTPIAGRNHAQLEEQIGFFVNTLVLRTNLREDPTFRELLDRVRNVSLGAYDHQDLPFEKLVEDLQPQRHVSRSPLIQVLFQLVSFSDGDLSLKHLDVSRLPSSGQRVRLDLEMYLWQQPKNIRGAVVYSTDLFDHATIERMVGHFVTLLEAVVEDADQRIDELPLLTEPERQQLLVEWNDTAIDYPRDKCVHQLFEEQVERTPDAVAVVFEDQELTYRELNERANQLAHHLIDLGVGPESLVGLCLERSPELVVSILAILKSGAAYLPIDPALPSERRQFMFEDSCPSAVITRTSLFAPPHGPDVPFVRLDEEIDTIAANGISNVEIDIAPAEPAYVIYTSGSTGLPKGVVGLHCGIVNRLDWMWKAYPFQSNDICCQKTTLSFVDSVWEIFGPLLCGVPTVLVPDAAAQDPRQLIDVLADHGVTRIVLVPSLLHTLLETCPDLAGRLPRLTHWVSSGERLRIEELRRFQDQLPDARLINLYGSSEVSADVTCFDVGASDVGNSIPIGRPISNTQVYVLDKRRHPVPIGVAGELYVGGAGLARGYLKRPELTADRFIQNPFSAEPDARLYRTGDLCRWREDGNLELLGRIDDQVKLRGFRIELGEIETLLNEHTDVAQCVVTLREDRAGDKRLVAYCVPAGESELNFSTVRLHLQQRLPDYMLPAAFVALDTLPLTPSGKVDRRVLPAPDDSRPHLETGYVAPRNTIEQQLASIWCEVLGIDKVGVHDNFFALGGHSLLAVQLFARMEKSCGRMLPLALLFQHGTIAHLASLLAESSPAAEIASDIATVVPLSHSVEGRSLFVMPSLGGELLFSRVLIEKLGARFPIFGIQPALAPQNLEQYSDFRTTAECFVTALRAAQPQGPYALVGYSYGGFMAYEVACRLIDMGEEVDLLAVIDAGPVRRGLKPQLPERIKILSRIVVNFPVWLREELQGVPMGRIVANAQRRIRRLYRFISSGGKSKRELDDAFDIDRIPSQNQELMRTVFAACRDWIPRPYAGRLTLFRAKTQPLLKAPTHDLGWARFVEQLNVLDINGNHESLLHPPHVEELARQLEELLECLD